MEDENENEFVFLQKKADAYCVLGTIVHISYKDGFWKRGTIKEVRADFFILDERLEGVLPVFFQEITKIEKFSELGEDRMIKEETNDTTETTN